jgi:hypothetical protein
MEFSKPRFTCGARRLANPPPFTHNRRKRDQFLNQSADLNSLRRGGFMVAVQSRIFQAGLMLAMALSASLLAGAAQAYTPEQQQACMGDALQLCGEYVPDVDRVTVCMIRNRARLSPGCRVYFRSPEPVAAPVAIVRKPVRITPAAARKPVGRKPVSVKPKKTKKPSGPLA